MDDQDSLRLSLLPPANEEETGKYEDDLAHRYDFPNDISRPITDRKSLGHGWCEESKKLWYIAGPAIFTSLCQYSLGAITQTFAGHIGDLELAVVSIENSVVGFSTGIMMGMGSALETLYGQSFGTGRLDMLGLYLQRSWIILLSTAMLESLIYVFATPLLAVIGQQEDIAEMAGTFALWILPQLFAYAMVFSLAKLFQAQRKVMVIAIIVGCVLCYHVINLLKG